MIERAIDLGNQGGYLLQKKWVNYGFIAIIFIIFVWTIYSNLFSNRNSISQSIAVGSHQIELAEEDYEVVELNVDNETEAVGHEASEQHLQDQDHEHEELTEYSTDHNHEFDDHDHEIYTTDIMDVSYPAHQFVTKTLDGETVRLSDYLGKKVIVNFWTTWCPPCQEEIPELQKFYEESMNHEDIVLIGLNITNEDLGLDVIGEFKEYYGITYPILLDETGEITNSYDILTIPTTYIIDEKGNIEKEILGPLTNEMLIELTNE